MHNRQRRGLRAFVALAVVIGFLLIVVHASAHGGAVSAGFVFLPVLLLGLVNVPRSLWPVAEIDLRIPHQLLEHSSLFQRPPPSA